jgi:NADH-quinone oxidoreductase subunit M
MHLLTAIILCPLLAALVTVFIPANYKFVIRLTALAATLLTALMGFILFCRFGAVPAVDGYRFTHNVMWVQSLHLQYHVGVDGINLGLIFMASIVAFAAACVSREIKKFEKEYYILLLVMAGGILGAFASLDLFFFYFFHELALVPTFIMIGVWGRGERRNYAAFQITIYLSIGALIALAGLIALYIVSGASSFDIVEISKHLRANPIPSNLQHLIFPFLLFGFGILVSLWPFHTWAPLGYASAPTATSMLHAGGLKKFGLYGLIRIAIPLLPEAARSWMHILAILCLGNIVYCGWVAMRQKDLNLLIGNSSVAHMGFVFLGLASLNVVGVTGAVLVMVAHGFLAALTFGLSGFLYAKTGTLEMNRMSGLLRKIPFIGAALMMALLAGCGLPGFANFAGEVLVLFGSWRQFHLVTELAVWGGLVIGAVYMLRAIRQILHGPLEESWEGLADASGLWQKLPFVLLLACLLVFGFFPRLLTDQIRTPAAASLAGFQAAPAAGQPPAALAVQTALPPR